jgi:dTDP-4-dehydrorhamnose reductase
MMDQQPIAVLGATGMAGHVAAAYLAERGYNVYSASRSIAVTAQTAAVDFTDLAALDHWLDQIQPEIIINCAGLLQKDCEERPDMAALINACLPHHLARYVTLAIKRGKANKNARLIHISTDCVFSGERGHYTETDPPDGRSVYDRSKALGEVVNDRDLTFRTSIVGPDRREAGTGLFNWFMRQKGPIRGFIKAIWSGVTTVELARAMDTAIKQNLTGLYQLAPDPPIDKYHLLCLFQQIFDRQGTEIIPSEEMAADKSLVNTRKDFDFVIQSYPEQIVQMKHWINAHSDWYGGRY